MALTLDQNSGRLPLFTLGINSRNLLFLFKLRLRQGVSFSLSLHFQKKSWLNEIDWDTWRLSAMVRIGMVAVSDIGLKMERKEHTTASEQSRTLTLGPKSSWVDHETELLFALWLSDAFFTCSSSSLK
eukprot:scaffold78569_cov77-Cyclotella_meneghiniana.AAC.5